MVRSPHGSATRSRRGCTRRNRWHLPEPQAAPPEDADALALISKIAHAIPRADEAAEAFQFALDAACPALDAALGAVFVMQGGAELMPLAAAYGWPDRHRPWLGEMRVRVGFGPSGEAASERRMIIVADVFEDASLEDWQEVAKELGFRALVAVPMEAAGSVRGVATFYFRDPGGPSARQHGLMRAVADLLAVVAERHEVRAQLRRLEAVLADERQAPLVRLEEDDTGATAG